MRAKKQRISGFGNYPKVESQVFRPESLAELQAIVKKKKHILARGFERSYGDSSVDGVVLDMKNLDCVLAYNKQSGILKAQAGMSLAAVLEMVVKDGWFLHVTPGTKFVSLGGAVASNIHGKNHHNYGSIGNAVLSLDIVTADGKKIKCSREEKKDLFFATLGGMGLTGAIYSVEIELKKVPSSYIDLEQIKCPHLDLVMETLDRVDAEHEYTVTWIDSFHGSGRGIVMTGDHSKKGGYSLHSKSGVPIPFTMPNILLNRFSLKIFNTLYYLLGRNKKAHVHYNGFFYPLDALHGWNKLYGSRGFTQYQFVIPFDGAREVLKEVLEVCSKEKVGSFLTILKRFKDEEQLISFPKAGYTLAMDFPITAHTKRVMKRLDGIVQKAGGRLYLTKDAFMDKKMLEHGYADLGKWKAIKKKYDIRGKFVSAQGRRLGLC